MGSKGSRREKRSGRCSGGGRAVGTHECHAGLVFGVLSASDTSSLVTLDCMFLHTRVTQAFFLMPGPPNLGLSRQFLHEPQSFERHAEHAPQRLMRLGFPLASGSKAGEAAAAESGTESRRSGDGGSSASSGGVSSSSDCACARSHASSSSARRCLLASSNRQKSSHSRSVISCPVGEGDRVRRPAASRRGIER